MNGMFWGVHLLKSIDTVLGVLDDETFDGASDYTFGILWDILRVQHSWRRIDSWPVPPKVRAS